MFVYYIFKSKYVFKSKNILYLKTRVFCYCSVGLFILTKCLKRFKTEMKNTV